MVAERFELGKGRGVGFKEVVIYDGNTDLNSTKTGLKEDYVKKGDPLVTFESVEPTHDKTESLLFKNVTHFKPYNEGAKKDIGFKFHDVGSITHIAPLVLSKVEQQQAPALPVELHQVIGQYGGKRNKKKRRKTRRTRKGTRNRKRTRNTRRKRNKHYK